MRYASRERDYRNPARCLPEKNWTPSVKRTAPQVPNRSTPVRLGDWTVCRRNRKTYEKRHRTGRLWVLLLAAVVLLRITWHLFELFWE